MPLLNEEIPYAAAATEQSRRLFAGEQAAYHEVLHTGTRLCRFARRHAISQEVCEWWMLFDDYALSNGRRLGGFSGFLAASASRIDGMGGFRVGHGVKLGCAEPNDRFVLVRLNVSVYAYMGTTVPMRTDPCGGALSLPGGEFRVWIPGLASSMVTPIGVPPELTFLPLPPQTDEGDPDPGE